MYALSYPEAEKPRVSQRLSSGSLPTVDMVHCITSHCLLVSLSRLHSAHCPHGLQGPADCFCSASTLRLSSAVVLQLDPKVGLTGVWPTSGRACCPVLQTSSCPSQPSARSSRVQGSVPIVYNLLQSGNTQGAQCSEGPAYLVNAHSPFCITRPCSPDYPSCPTE